MFGERLNSLTLEHCNKAPTVAEVDTYPDFDPARHCRYRRWSWHFASGEVAPFNCKSWSCPIHAASQAYKWSQRLVAGAPTRVITLTDLPSDGAVLRTCWQLLIRALRSGEKARHWITLASGKRKAVWVQVRKPYQVQYGRVLERGTKGRHKLHFHIAVRGDYIPQRVLSDLAARYGFGRVVYIQAVKSLKQIWYLSKYMTKGSELNAHGVRRVNVSREYILDSDVADDGRVHQSDSVELAGGNLTPVLQRGGVEPLDVSGVVVTPTDKFLLNERVTRGKMVPKPLAALLLVDSGGYWWDTRYVSTETGEIT